jgi:hypothetical protein
MIKIPPVGTLVYLVWEDSGVGAYRENIAAKDLQCVTMESVGWITGKTKTEITWDAERELDHPSERTTAVQGGTKRKNILVCVPIHRELYAGQTNRPDQLKSDSDTTGINPKQLREGEVLQ